MRKLKNHFPKSYSMVRMVFNPNSYIYKSGWMESLKRGYPSDRRGNPLPWMNYPMVKLLDERLSKSMTVFEYGCGYSTLFYAERTSRVTSIEHQEKWAELMNRKLPQNAQVVLSSPVDYAEYINTLNESYDVIIVDGIDRVNCVKNCLGKLSDTGVLILDDSSRGEYREAHDFLSRKEFKSLSLAGLKPTGIGVDETTIFYRTENCFGI